MDARANRTKRRCVVIAMTILSALSLAVSVATAQSAVGPFAEFNTWWVHPSQGTLGVSFDGVNIQIDRDGDGTAEATFAPPASMPIAARSNLRLSPSREILYTFGGSCASGGTLVHFYAVPSGAGPLTPIRTSLCISGGILRHPGFYDTGLCDPVVGGPGLDCAPGGVPLLSGSPQRVAYLVSQGQGSTLDITWIDLDSGDVATMPGLEPGLGFIQVSPSGTMAFVQHDLPSPMETDYMFVDLCPGDLGATIDTGAASFDDQGGNPFGTALNASVTLVVGGIVTVDVTSQNGQAIGGFTLDDCFGFFPNGACCNGDGSCDPAATQSQCQTAGGNWLGVGRLCGSCPLPPNPRACCYADGRACADIDAATCAASGGAPQGDGSTCGLTQCPTVDLTINKAGPATVQFGDLIDYTLSYANNGAADASNVRIVDAVPAGSTFVSASAAGGHQAGVVTWNVGDVPAGASGQVSFTCRADCGISQITNAAIDYEIIDAAGAVIQGVDDVVTDIIDLPNAPIAMTVDSAASNGVPLHPGDLVTHTITLINTSGAPLAGVYLAAASGRGIDFGDAVSFDQVIDDGGGLVNTNGGRFDWQGDIAASASVTIAFSAVVDAIDPCAVQAAVQTRLNFGNAIRVLNGCDDEIASVDPPSAIDIQPGAPPNVTAAIAATNLASAQTVQTSTQDYQLQLARPDDDLDIDLVLTNTTPQDAATVDVTVDMAGLDLPANPFINASGATYIAATSQINWSGSIAANQSVTISFAGRIDACRAELRVTGGIGPACSGLGASLVVAAAPVPPINAYIAAAGVGASPFVATSTEDHVLLFDPATDSDLRTLLCIPSESMTRIGVGATGDIWVGGQPTIRLNPNLLDFDVIDLSPIQTAGLVTVEDIAPDPDAGVVYFIGESAAAGPLSTAVVRYDQSTVQADLVIDTTAIGSVDNVAVDHDGMIVIAGLNSNGVSVIIRIDPDDPGAFDVFDGGGLVEPVGLSIGTNGEYVIADGPGAISPWALASMNSTNGSVTVIASDLQSVIPISQPPVATAVAPNGDIYVAPGGSGLARISGHPPVGDVVVPFAIGGAVIGDMDFANVGTNGSGGGSNDDGLGDDGSGGGGSGGGGSGGGGSGGGGSGGDGSGDDGGGGSGDSGGGGDSSGGGENSGGGSSEGGTDGGSAVDDDQNSNGAADDPDNVITPDATGDDSPPADQPTPPTNLVIDDADTGGFGSPQDIPSEQSGSTCGAGGLCGALSAINLMLIVVGMSRLRTRIMRRR